MPPSRYGGPCASSPRRHLPDDLCPERSGRRLRSRPSTPLTRSISAVAARRSDSFTRNSFSPRMRVTPSANDAATARIGYSSIMDGARSGGTSTPLSADVRTRRSAISSPPSRFSRSSMLAPISRNVVEQTGTQRIGHDGIENQFGARHDQRGDQGKCCRRRIGGNHDSCRLELGLALQDDTAAVVAVGFARNLCAKMFQQSLGVIARRLSFDHRSLSRRRKSRQQHRRLQLRRCHRWLVDDRNRIGCAFQRKRKPPSFGNMDDTCTHLLQRVEHALHRPAAQGFIAVKGCRDRQRRPRHQSQAGTPVPELPKSSALAGCAKPADSDPVDAPGLITGSLNPRAERTHDIGGAQDVLALQQACDRAFRQPSGRQESERGEKSTYRRAPGPVPGSGRLGGLSAASVRKGSRTVSSGSAPS